ncbi:MAG: EAL domain-containing protein [Thiobacillaceae bacterium]|nr:EAL domain-containing protein [Thiobacillaceae bacterium]
MTLAIIIERAVAMCRQSVWRLALLLLAGWLGPAGAWAAEKVSLFILHSYSQDYPWTKLQHEGFMDRLRSDTGREYGTRVEYLDTKRVSYDPAYAEWMAAHLAKKYAGYRPRAIYVTDDNALSFALSYMGRIFADSPVIFSGINNYQIRPQLDPAHVTGVFERKEIAPNLALMRRIAPNIRDILVVGDASETYSAIRQELLADLESYPDIRPYFVSTNRLKSLIERLKGRPERFVFLTTLGAVRDESGEPLSLAETISAITQSGPYTIFSMEDAYILPGVLGGYVTSGRRQGETAAEMLLRHLSGTPLSAIAPVEQSPNEYIIDAAQLAKTGMRLPEEVAREATLLNPLPSFYDRHQRPILASLYVLSLLFVASLLISIHMLMGKNRLITRSARQLSEQARHLQEVQESLTRAQHVAHMGTWDWGIQENSLYWSEGIYSLFGLSHKQFEASYENFLERVHPDDRQRVDAAVNDALAGGAPYDLIHRVILPDGRIRVMHEQAEILRDASGAPLRMTGMVRDITSEDEAGRALRESEEKLRTVIETFPLILWAIDRDGVFTLSRGAGLKALGLQPDEVVGASVFEQYRDFPEILDDIRRALAGENLVTTRWLGDLAFEVRYTPLLDETRKIKGVIGVAADVTERMRYEQRLAALANYDQITQLPNRALFRDRLAHAIQLAERSQGMLGLLFLDLDQFKSINDTLGHAAGDELLVQVAQRLRSVVRASDTVCRLGGDEFTVIMENLHDADETSRVATSIVESLAPPFRLLGKEIYVTCSLGIAIYPQDGDNVDALLMNADAAMYQAKDYGRNNFQYYTQEINQRAQQRLELANQLRMALERNEFELHFQPQVRLGDHRVIGFEALLRWNHPMRGRVAPNLFIPMLEETGLIVQVGEWVLNEACRWAAALPPGDGPDPHVSVNLSARQFRQQELIHSVRQALAISGLAAERLELEITESSLVDLLMSPDSMASLKSLGLHLSLDDFGTGYSSLSYLKHFPLDRLKIDASFVRDLVTDPSDAGITAAIIVLGHKLGLRVIAEGVETDEQLAMLQELGCDEIQGYLVARPMSGDEAAEWLRASRQDDRDPGAIRAAKLVS